MVGIHDEEKDMPVLVIHDEIVDMAYFAGGCMDVVGEDLAATPEMRISMRAACQLFCRVMVYDRVGVEGRSRRHKAHGFAGEKPGSPVGLPGIVGCQFFL